MSKMTSSRPCCIITTYQILILVLLSAAPEEEWNKMLINGITLGKGEISPEELHAVIKKRIERTLIRTVGTPLFLEPFDFQILHIL